jgi:hypothetical protein
MALPVCESGVGFLSSRASGLRLYLYYTDGIGHVFASRQKHYLLSHISSPLLVHRPRQTPSPDLNTMRDKSAQRAE